MRQEQLRERRSPRGGRRFHISMRERPSYLNGRECAARLREIRGNTVGRVAFAGVLFLFASLARADWPMLGGGPTHVGVAQSGPQKLVVKWSTTLGASVDSSPAVQGDRVYVGTSDGELCALRRDGGEVVWRFPTAGAVVSSPAVSANSLYFGSVDRHIYCLTLDGKLRWRYRTWGPVVGSPTVAEGMVFCGSMDGTMTALDPATGEMHWQYQEKKGVVCAPAVGAGLVVYGDHSGTVLARRADTGALAWSAASPNAVRASPVIAGGTVVVPYRSYTALKPPKVDYLVAYDLQTGARQWAQNGEASVFTTPAVAEGVVYFGHVEGYLSQTEMRAVRLADGKLLWKQRFAPLMVASSPVVAGDRLFIGMGDGTVYALRLSTGSTLSRLTLAPRLYSSAAVSGGHLFIGASDGKLYCLGE